MAPSSSVETRSTAGKSIQGTGPKGFQEKSASKPTNLDLHRYLSSTATLLFISYQLHNIVSWRKIKPFLPRWGHLTFIFTIIAVQPFWIVEAWNNFQYFNGLGNQSNIQTRPWEALARYENPGREIDTPEG